MKSKLVLLITLLLQINKFQQSPAYLTLLCHRNEQSFIEFSVANYDRQTLNNRPRVPDKDLNKVLNNQDYEQTTRSVITAKLLSYVNDDVAFFYNEKYFFRYNNSINALKSDLNLNVVGDIELDSSQDQLIFDQSPIWKLYKHEDFQSDRQGWSRDSVSNCKTNENLFLGGYCNFAGEEVSKTYNNLPKHHKLQIEFSFHFIDEWTGEYAYAKLDGQYIWVQNHYWCDKVLPWFCRKYGINTCGNEFPDYLSKFVSFTLEVHTADSFTIAFGSTLTKNACQASWGLDDLQIYFI